MKKTTREFSVVDKTEYKYVRCVFYDHCSDMHMEWRPELEPLKPKLVGTGGWLIDDQDTYITLAMAIDEDGMIMGKFTILKVNIVGELIEWD
jgi:hypothetical protein